MGIVFTVKIQTQANTLILIAILLGDNTSLSSSLVHRAVKICRDNKLNRELARIKDLVAWNGFPKRVGQAIAKSKRKRLNFVSNINNSENNTDVETIWINIPHLGSTGDQLLQTLKRKLKHNLINDVRFKVMQSTKKFSYYTNMKDHISKLMKSYVVYQFNFPGCNKCYIGNTEWSFCTKQKKMLVLTKIVPFIIILELVLTTIILKVSSDLKTIHSME